MGRTSRSIVEFNTAPNPVEVVMPAPADTLSLVVEPAANPKRRQVLAPSVEDHREVSEIDEPAIGCDTLVSYNHGGAVFVAYAWLAFYVIASIHHFMASGH